MLRQVSTDKRLASLGVTLLLLVTGIAGVSLVLPLESAHAATPTVSLWTITNGLKTPATSGTVGSTIVITGTGFGPAMSIAIFSVAGSITVPWLKQRSCATTDGGVGIVNSLVAEGCLMTTAAGDFQVSVALPKLPGGPNIIAVSDGTVSASAIFTITPSVRVTFAGDNFGFPEESITPSIKITGFGSGESVTIATTMWTKTSFSCVTGSTVGTLGSCTESAATAVADVTGGRKAITATGATSGFHATTEYKVNPWVAFYDSPTGGISYSFIGTAPTSIVVEAHGLTAGKLASNSITVAGVSTNHAAVTIGTNGEFHTAGAKLVVSPTSNVPFGLASVVIKGETFSYASGNIALAPGTWGGALISSIIGSATTTGVAAVSATSFMPGSITVSLTSPAPPLSQIGFFGYGFVPNAGGGGTLSIATPAGAQYSTAVAFNAGNGGVGGANGVAKPDANGAFFATAVLGDTPWSSASTPTTATSYAATVTQAATGPANVLSPSFGVAPWIQSPAPATVDYTTSTEAVTAHGFSSTEPLTLTVGGSAMVTGGTCTTSTAGTCTTAAGRVPDLAGGAQSIDVAGALSGIVTADSLTYDPVVNFASGQTLSVDSGKAGVTTTIRTGDGYGVHGLRANAAYNIVWNAISGSITVGTFTSTSTGGIPGSGISFAIRSGSSGIHILDLQSASGASALYAGQVYDQATPTEPPFNGTYTTAYGDMLFNEVASALP